MIQIFTTWKWLEENRDKYDTNLALIKARESREKYCEWVDRNKYEEARRITADTSFRHDTQISGEKLPEKFPVKLVDKNTHNCYMMAMYQDPDKDCIMIEEYTEITPGNSRRTLREEIENLNRTPRDIEEAQSFIKKCHNEYEPLIGRYGEDIISSFMLQRDPDMDFHREYTSCLESVCNDRELYDIFIKNNVKDEDSIKNFIKKTRESFQKIINDLTVIDEELKLYSEYQSYFLNYCGPRSIPGKSLDSIKNEIIAGKYTLNTTTMDIRHYDAEYEKQTRETCSLEIKIEEYKKEFDKFNQQLGA
jgi:hypothetical protein